MCLAIPDICGAIDSIDGRADRTKYIDWYDQYAASNCPYFDGQACYFFRCSMLHQGSTINPSSNYSRILFIEPGATTNVFHCNVINDALNLDVRIFCNAMLDGAELWLNNVMGTARFSANYDKFLRRYPTGLPPYIVGIPVIG